MVTMAEIIRRIEYEGLEYTFLDYYAVEEIPVELKNAVNKFLSARTEIKAILDEFNPN